MKTIAVFAERVYGSTAWTMDLETLVASREMDELLAHKAEQLGYDSLTWEDLPSEYDKVGNHAYTQEDCLRDFMDDYSDYVFENCEQGDTELESDGLDFAYIQEGR